MDGNDEELPQEKKPKNLKAATHILKKVALRRYRQKLLLNSDEEISNSSLTFPDSSGSVAAKNVCIADASSKLENLNLNQHGDLNYTSINASLPYVPVHGDVSLTTPKKNIAAASDGFTGSSSNTTVMLEGQSSGNVLDHQSTGIMHRDKVDGVRVQCSHAIKENDQLDEQSSSKSDLKSESFGANKELTFEESFTKSLLREMEADDGNPVTSPDLEKSNDEKDNNGLLAEAEEMITLTDKQEDKAEEMITLTDKQEDKAEEMITLTDKQEDKAEEEEAVKSENDKEDEAEPENIYVSQEVRDTNEDQDDTSSLEKKLDENINIKEETLAHGSEEVNQSNEDSNAFQEMSEPVSQPAEHINSDSNMQPELSGENTDSNQNDLQSDLQSVPVQQISMKATSEETLEASADEIVDAPAVDLPDQTGTELETDTGIQDEVGSTVIANDADLDKESENVIEATEGNLEKDKDTTEVDISTESGEKSVAEDKAMDDQKVEGAEIVDGLPIQNEAEHAAESDDINKVQENATSEEPVKEEKIESSSKDEGSEGDSNIPEPPIVETILPKSPSPKEREGPPDDFFYEVEEYQSKSYVSNNSGIPTSILKFFHSFGYDCRKRSNLHLLSGPTGLFAAGNMIHMLNLTTGEHQFLRSCSGGGIGALAVHPSGKYFAVAEKGVKPHILIYEFPSLKLYRLLKGGTEKAYSFIDFNPKGNLLASVGSAPDYMLTLWDWTKEKTMLRSKAFSQEVYRVTFSPELEGQLTTCGTTHIRFWKMALTFTGLKLKGELGRFGKTALGDIEGYIQLPDGKVLSGSDWGNMLLWDGGLIKVEICRKNQKPCHIGSIQQLVIDEGELITIGLDGYVRVWELEALDSADTTDESDVFEIEPMNELKVGNDVQLTSMVKASVKEDPSLEEGAAIWYAQDANGGIWKLDLSFSHTTKPPEKLFSYTAGAITGIACSPRSQLMATTGDAYVRIYDYLRKKILCHYQSPTPHTRGTSLVWPSKVIDPKGTTVIAGFSDGIMRILTLQLVDKKKELILKQVMKPHSSSITAMAFDNTGELLASGSTDRTVFFFLVGEDDYEPMGFVKVPGEVTNMQWSPAGFPDTTLLVSCSNGKVVEITAPSSTDTSHSFMLTDISIKYFTFQSVKSQLRRDEEKEEKEKQKALQRKEREEELQRRMERGEEISDEDAQAYLSDDPMEKEEAEEEPLFIPSQPSSVLQAVYLTPGRFFVSMSDYDAGYLYECAFPEDNEARNPDALIAPIRAVPVSESDDVAVSTLHFTADRHKLVAGFQNGMIRVYPLEDDPETLFDLDMLKDFWNLNIHDNDTGTVTHVVESYDHVHLFSSGGDGNIFGYLSLDHAEIAQRMEGRRAKLPTPKKISIDEPLVDDIDDPQAYSIEDAKLKAEHDKMVREAEAKKVAERRRIGALQKSFLELLHKNANLPASVQLQRSEFELDPSLRQKMIGQTQERIDRVSLEMQWDKAKLALAHQKLHKRFRSQLECGRIIVHSVKTSHVVASYRVSHLAEEFHAMRESVEQRVRAASLVSESGAVGPLNGAGASQSSDLSKNEAESIDDASFLSGTKQKNKATILQGRQAEKVAKALKKAEEAKMKREKRSKEWEELYKSKPDDNYEDPADVSAIREAQANMGDFKLKTAPDYVVPEHLRIDTEKKRYQILVLQELVHRAKSDFNTKLISLRDNKLAVIEETKKYVEEVKKLQSKMEKSERVKVPVIPSLHPAEQPHKKYEYTRESLLTFEEDEKQREIDAAMKKRKGDGGLFGGFGDEDGNKAPAPAEPQSFSRKAASSVASSALSKTKDKKAVPVKSAPALTVLEQQLAQVENIRLRYQRDRLLRLIDEKLTAFDAELRLLRHAKVKLDVDLKMADLRQVTLIEELLLLKEYEKRETTLSGRVTSKRNELIEINNKAAEMQVKFEAKRRDIDRLSDREKALHASFTASLGDNNKFADFLNKVFKKKIKRAKKKVVTEGEEDDSDVSSSDESDWSSEEDEDDSVDGGFDDSVCPPGCDQNLFDSTLTLREKRLDLEEALVEEKKMAETLKKDADAFVKKAKVIESQLKTALADLEAFQVEKQGKLNELDIVVPLRLHQVEHVYNASVPSDLTSCLVFANSSLTSLQRRIKELQQEKSEQRKFYKEARLQHVHLIKNRRVIEKRIEQMEEKCEQMMMLKFGRIVDLEKIDTVTINKNVEELKEKVRLNEVKNANELLKRQKRIINLKDRITELTRANTKKLEALNVMVNDKDNLEQELDKRLRTMELQQKGKNKSEIQEQHRLVQLVQLQAQEIQALKEEIGLLSRKGGHILPPAQPPLGQDNDVL